MFESRPVFGNNLSCIHDRFSDSCWTHCPRVFLSSHKLNISVLLQWNLHTVRGWDVHTVTGLRVKSRVGRHLSESWMMNCGEKSLRFRSGGCWLFTKDGWLFPVVLCQRRDTDVRIMTSSQRYTLAYSFPVTSPCDGMCAAAECWLNVIFTWWHVYWDGP